MDRCLVETGLVALVCYPDPQIPSSTTLNTALNYINQEFLVDYFPETRKQYFADRYASIKLPYNREEFVIDLNIPLTYPNLIELLSSWSGFQIYCTHHKLSVPKGCKVLDQVISQFIKEEEKKTQHVLRYNCTMVTSVKT